MTLAPRDKKILQVTGVIAGVGLLAWLVKDQIDKRDDSGAPASSGGGAPGPDVMPTLPPPAVGKKPAANPATEFAPDAILSFGSKRKKMVAQLQHVINAIARLYKEPQIAVDGVWGNGTETRAKKYFGKSQITYNRAHNYAEQLYLKRGLSYPDGKPLASVQSAFKGGATVLPTQYTDVDWHEVPNQPAPLPYYLDPSGFDSRY